MRSTLALPVLMLSCCSFLAVAAMALTPHPRPKITGISHIAVYSSDMKATEHYYVDSIGLVKVTDRENKLGARYNINLAQFIEVLPLPAGAGINRLDHTAWNTDDVEGIRLYLAEKGWKVPAKVTSYPGEGKTFRVEDPEGNAVEFVQPPVDVSFVVPTRAVGFHIIHIGFLVHSREAEDKFYRDLLGFR